MTPQMTYQAFAFESAFACRLASTNALRIISSCVSFECCTRICSNSDNNLSFSVAAFKLLIFVALNKQPSNINNLPPMMPAQMKPMTMYFLRNDLRFDDCDNSVSLELSLTDELTASYTAINLLSFSNAIVIHCDNVSMSAFDEPCSLTVTVYLKKLKSAGKKVKI